MANPAHLSARFRCVPPPPPFPASFGIVTAFNPGDSPAPLPANQEADSQLEKDLAERGWLHFRVTGGDADFTHAEPGWGIAAAREDLLAIGRQYRQASLYWIEGDDLWLCACDGSESLPLGSWRARTAFLPM